MWDALGQDLRYALRTMRRSPAFTTVAILSLALGIGANAAIFSLVDRLLLRSLRVRDPGQLVELLRRYPGDPHVDAFSWNTYEFFRDHNRVFSALLADGPSPGHARMAGSAVESVTSEYVSEDFFEALGIRPAVGRLIRAEDGRANPTAHAAVASWVWWKNHFNLDPAVLGKPIVVDDVPATIVGVTPRSFSGLQAGVTPDFWLPFAAEPPARRAVPAGRPPLRHGVVRLLGRLRPGISIEQARAEMALLYRQSMDAHIDDDQFTRVMTMEVEPARAGLSTHVRDQFARPLALLMGVVAVLLLIACINLASMLLARGAARQRELAVRVSLGASRWRLARQFLTESLLLSAAGAVAGVMAAYAGAGALARIVESGRDNLNLRPAIHLRPGVDSRMLLFAAGVALLTGVLFGLAPALHAFGAAPAGSLGGAGRTGETRLRRLFGKGLIVAQVALSALLLSGAGLFLGHLANLRSLDVGIRRDHVLLVSLDASDSGLSRERLARVYQNLLGRLDTIPGVRSATLSALTPISGAGASRDARVEGYPYSPGETRRLVENWVAPKYFETLGTPLLLGRDFNAAEEGRPGVAIVNQSLARYYFGDASPLGRRVTFDGDDHAYEIVGVAADAKYTEIREKTWRTIYFNAFQSFRGWSQFSLRTSVPPTAVVADVRRAVHDAAPGVVVSRVTTMEDQIDSTIVPERLMATLSGAFGALGAAIVAIGLYGLLAYTVARRVNEIGVRMALGATRAAVVGIVVRDGLATVCAGLMLGAPLVFWGKGLAAAWLVGLPPGGAAPVAIGALAMIAIGLLAAWAPARRAARVDPMEALRHE